MEENKQILDGIQNQISSFDNKASILLSIVGIIFALTMSFLDVFHTSFYVEQNTVFKGWFSSIFVIYIIITILIIVSFILVIIPRTNKEKTKYPNYYRDIKNMTKEELKQSLIEYSNSNELIIEQIMINSSICNKKHFWSKIGITLMIPFILCIISLIFMIIFA